MKKLKTDTTLVVTKKIQIISDELDFMMLKNILGICDVETFDGVDEFSSLHHQILGNCKGVCAIDTGIDDKSMSYKNKPIEIKTLRKYLDTLETHGNYVSIEYNDINTEYVFDAVEVHKATENEVNVEYEERAKLKKEALIRNKNRYLKQLKEIEDKISEL